MGKLKIGGIEISTLLKDVRYTSDPVGIRENYTKKRLENEVSLCVDPIVQAAVGEAKERQKKLEQDYQRTFRKYKELQLMRYECNMEGKGLKHHSRWAGYYITDCKDVVKELQEILDSLNIEKTSRHSETPNHSKKFLMLHGCRSLRQEKMILQQKAAEHIQPNNDKQSKKAINYNEISFNLKLHKIRRNFPRIINKKHEHKLLSELKVTKRLMREAATEGAAYTTSQESIQTSTSSVIKLLAKVIKDLEKEKEKTDNMLLEKTSQEKGYTYKMTYLQKKKEWISGKWDDERKYILRLKNIDDGWEYLLQDSERWRRQPFIYFV